MRMTFSSALAVIAATTTRKAKANTVSAAQIGRVMKRGMAAKRMVISCNARGISARSRAAGRRRNLVGDQFAERTRVAGDSAIDSGRGPQGQLGKDEFRKAVSLLQVRVAGQD